MGRSKWDYIVGKKQPCKIHDDLHISQRERRLTTKATQEAEARTGAVSKFPKNSKQRRQAW